VAEGKPGRHQRKTLEGGLMAVHDQGAGRKRATIADLLVSGEDFTVVTVAADIFAVDPRTIRSRISDGVIPAVNIGTEDRPEYRVPVRWILEQAGAAVAA
jgi:hypothetical protein